MRERSPAFSKICPFSPRAANEDEIAETLFPDATNSDERIGRYEAAYVGAVVEPDFRAEGSSGGMVSWVAAELLRTQCVDGIAHVVAAEDPTAGGGLFHYTISRTLAEVRRGAKSRYYPIELSGVLRAIREQPGRYAVVGVPCFIKAINLLRAHDPVLKERVIFTLGLYCGHMKSARMVESFAWQMGADAAAVKSVSFRLKAPGRPANHYAAQLGLRDGDVRTKDWSTMVDGDWGSGFFQNSACNSCDDVVAETADIAFGDAWVEPYSSDEAGTNVVLVRSAHLIDMLKAGIEDGRLSLQPVDRDFVVATQAAGFRQRREGLAYRLSWRRRGFQPRKRVEPSRALPVRRKLIYRIRAHISAASHPIFRLSRAVGRPGLFLGWGRLVLTVYHALAYSRGRLGRVVDKLSFLSEKAP